MSYSATELRCYNNCYLNVVFTLTQGKPAIHVEDDSDDDDNLFVGMIQKPVHAEVSRCSLECRNTLGVTNQT